MIFLWLFYPLIEAMAQGWCFQNIKGFGKKPKTKDPFYIILFFIRGNIALLFGAFVLNLQDDAWYVGLAMIAFQAASFWIIFDPLLNWYRDKGFTYEGENSGWLKSIPYPVQFAISIVICVVSYVLLYKLGY